MSKKGLVAFIIAAIVLLSLIPRSIRPVFGQAASIEAPHFGEGGLPQFEKDPSFPKVLGRTLKDGRTGSYCPPIDLLRVSDH